MASKTLHAEGVIEAVARNGKAFKIGEDWFSVYKVGQLNEAKKGDEVEFDYIEKKVGGAVFLNVEGDVTILNEGAEEEKPAARGRSSGPSSKPAPKRETRATTSESPDQRQRSIVRQNSLTQANSLLETMARAGTLGDGGPEELAELVIELARVFEKYSMVEDQE